MSALEDYTNALKEDIELETADLPPLLHDIEEIRSNNLRAVEASQAETEPTERKMTSWAIYSAMMDAS